MKLPVEFSANVTLDLLIVGGPKRTLRPMQMQSNRRYLELHTYPCSCYELHGASCGRESEILDWSPSFWASE
jgi:hypothetical protein